MFYWHYVTCKTDNSPCYYDEEVKPIPSFTQVAIFTNKTHRCDFDNHFNEEESVDHMIKVSENSASGCGATLGIVAWLIHP